MHKHKLQISARDWKFTDFTWNLCGNVDRHEMKTSKILHDIRPEIMTCLGRNKIKRWRVSKRENEKQLNRSSWLGNIIGNEKLICKIH